MTIDFKADTIKISQIIASGVLGKGQGAKLVVYDQNSEGNIPDRGSINQNIFPTSSLDGRDIFLYISGGINDKNSNNRSITVFGGDVLVSGSLTSETGFSGSLTMIDAINPLFVTQGDVSMSINQSTGQIVLSILDGNTTFSGLDETNNPVGFWKFDNNLSDSSGNNHHLIRVDGSERYTKGLFDRKALFLDKSSSFGMTNSDAFKLTGAFTIQSLVYIQEFGNEDNLVNPTRRGLFEQASPNELESGNEPWCVTLQEYNKFGFLHETGTGTNIIVTSSLIVPPGEWIYMAMTRDDAITGSQRLRGYINRTKIFERYVTPATGGATSYFSIGTGIWGPAFFYGAVQDLKILSQSLTDGQILEDAIKCGF